MQMHHLYRIITEIYLLISVLVSPLFCIIGWLLFGKIISKRLRSYAYWYLPAVIGGSLSAGSILLIAFLRYFGSRDYALASVAYLVVIAGVPFHIVAFVRFWKTISDLPLGIGEQPQLNNAEQDAGVWPPQPRR